MTTVRANYDPDYFRRFIWLSLGCLVFGSWFLFDGLVTYPRELERSRAYWLPTEDRAEPWQAIDADKWREMTQQNGWSDTVPGEKPDKQEEKIGTQYFYAVVCFLITVPCLLKWFLPRGSWVEGTDTGVRTSWGTEFDYDQIRRIDKHKWDTRGIAKIRYERDGATHTFTFDDYKYQRAAMNEILQRMEAGLSDDQIVGAPRETVRQAQLKAAQAAQAGSATTDSPAADDSAD